MKISRPIKILVALAILSILFIPVVSQFNTVRANGPKLNKIQQRLESGFAALELSPQPAGSDPAPKNFVPSGDDGCSTKISDNVKVNQNCLNLSDSNRQGRGQAQNEVGISQDANNPSHVVASYNDYRRGDGTCGVSYSLDGGKAWQDSTVPNGFTKGTAFGGVARQYWQASGDTSVAWDTKGNAYLDCQIFLRGDFGITNNPDQSSAVYVLRSTGSFGASWNFVAHPVIEFNDVAGTGCCLLDKPYMAVDNHVGSPFQDRVYVTWTFFNGDGTAYIFGSHSDDFGQTFSSPVVVSTNSVALCPVTFGIPTPNGNCNENQFSDPFTGPDGTLYVAFLNFNNAVTGSDNRNQILLTKSTDGGVSFSSPVKVGDWYDLPDCATFQAGQDAGRACVPEKGSSTNSVFRATNYPAGSVNPNNPTQVAVTFGSYINVDSNEANGCTPAGFSFFGLNLYTGVKTAGACNNKILLSISNDGGATFTGGTTDPRSLLTVNQDPAQKTTDQWWQWATFTSDGKLAVSYYDRQYGSDETTGTMDISLSGSKDLSSFTGAVRVTSTSMPLPTEFPDSLGNSLFLGDYAGLTAVKHAHPVWADTRDIDLFLCPLTGVPGVPPAVCTGSEPNGLTANDEDIFTSEVVVPG